MSEQELVAASGKNRIVAAVLAIFLGGWGIHKFYLGNTKPAVIMLVLYISGWSLAILVIGLFWVWIPALIGFIEGIIYLTKSDEEFEEVYAIGQKAWF